MQQDLVLATPSPTLPRKREREHTEIASLSSVHSRPSFRRGELQRESSLTESWNLGPRFRGDERRGVIPPRA
jgi:hypothetical protein